MSDLESKWGHKSHLTGLDSVMLWKCLDKQKCPFLQASSALPNWKSSLNPGLITEPVVVLVYFSCTHVLLQPWIRWRWTAVETAPCLNRRPVVLAQQLCQKWSSSVKLMVNQQFWQGSCKTSDPDKSGDPQTSKPYPGQVHLATDGEM